MVMRWLIFLLLCTVASWFLLLPGCSSNQEPSSVICEPSQLVRCNSCPQTGQCSGAVCRGWLQCSSDGTSFEGACSNCEPDDPSEDSCASLQTCCQQSTLSSNEKSTCAGIVMENDEDDCYALLNQYLDSKSCGGVSNPPPPPPDGGSVTGACSNLAPCCEEPGNSPSAAGACSQLVSSNNDTACADATGLYCSSPSKEAGCTSCPETGPPDSSMPDVTSDVSEDGGFEDASVCDDAASCDASTD
jgi:hypothetical protein